MVSKDVKPERPSAWPSCVLFQETIQEELNMNMDCEIGFCEACELVIKGQNNSLCGNPVKGGLGWQEN